MMSVDRKHGPPASPGIQLKPQFSTFPGIPVISMRLTLGRADYRCFLLIFARLPLYRISFRLAFRQNPDLPPA